MRYTGPWFNINMTSYQHRKSHCGDKTILRPSYLHNWIPYTGKTTSLYWIRAQVCVMHSYRRVTAHFTSFCRMVNFDRHLIMKIQVITSMKRVSVSKHDQTAAPALIQSMNLTSVWLICAHVMLKRQLSSPFCRVCSLRVSNGCLLGKPDSALCEFIWIARVVRLIATRVLFGLRRKRKIRWIMISFVNISW